jgi:hypothetical protein
MSLAKRKNKSFNRKPFVAVFWELLNSEAYRKLTASAAKALPYFLGKNGSSSHKEGNEYSGTFELSYGEAKRYGFATRTFSRVIQELVEKGFVDPAGYGGLRGFCKSFNKFKISDRWKQYGTKHFITESWKQTE